MIPFDDALELVLNTASPLAPRRVALEDVRGLVLGEDILATEDVPRFTNSAMDGFAVRAADITQVPCEMHVLDEVTAGKDASTLVIAGNAAAIMTGAPVPEGADSIVIVEHTESDGTQVLIKQRPAPGDHVRPRGEEVRAGDVLLPARSALRPYGMALLASHGHTTPLVIPRPTVAIIATGTELVPPDETPGAAHIRDSNSTLLSSLTLASGATPVTLGIGTDDEDRLRALVNEGLKQDVLVLSGGVSMGTRDLVPQILQEAGVEVIFHKIQMKPGKPVFFGKKDETLVFGLPGNPVSSAVGFHLLVKPALRLLMGYDDASTSSVEATLSAPVRIKAKRTTFLRGISRREDGRLLVEPVLRQGSHMLTGIATADCLIRIDVGEGEKPAGSPVRVIALEGTL